MIVTDRHAVVCDHGWTHPGDACPAVATPALTRVDAIANAIDEGWSVTARGDALCPAHRHQLLTTATKAPTAFQAGRGRPEVA